MKKKTNIFRINEKIEPMSFTIPQDLAGLFQSSVSQQQPSAAASQLSLPVIPTTLPKKMEDESDKKVEVEKIKIRTSFRLKLDIISMSFIVIFIFAFDIMQGIVNQPEYKQFVTIVQSILVSALIGIAVYGALSPALQVYPKYSNTGLLDDILKGLPYFIVILISAVVNSTFIPASRLSLGTSRMFAAMFGITNAFSEEMTFCLFLCSLLFARAKNKRQLQIYNLLISLLFMAYHLFVYQNPAELAHMFISRFMLNLSYMKTQRLSIPLIFHVLNNLYAALPILMGGL